MIDDETLRYRLTIGNIMDSMDFQEPVNWVGKNNKKKRVRNKVPYVPNVKAGVIKNNLENIKSYLIIRMPMRRIAKKIGCNYSQLYKYLKRNNMIPDCYKNKPRVKADITTLPTSISFDFL